MNWSVEEKQLGVDRMTDLITKIDGIDTREYDIYQRHRVLIPTPEEDVDPIPIKGRDGTLTKKYGYKDITILIDFYYHEKGKSFETIFRNFKSNLINSSYLVVNEDNGMYYKIKSMKIDEALNERFDVGEFTIQFTLAPYQYEIENAPIILTSPKSVTNDGYKCLPIITATVAGTGNIYIGDQQITVKDVNGTITIDSEMQNAYRKGSPPQNMNKHMIGKFPVFENGNNAVSFDGDISKLEIVMNRRWV